MIDILAEGEAYFIPADCSKLTLKLFPLELRIVHSSNVYFLLLKKTSHYNFTHFYVNETG